jgi:hypothetical protein
LVENLVQGLCGEEEVVDSIPCVISGDQTKFIVFLNELDVKKFSKSTLLNLVGTAEQISPACQQLVFIVSRSEKNNYNAFKKMFEVVGTTRMTKSEIGSYVNSSDLPQILQQYGFYRLPI